MTARGLKLFLVAADLNFFLLRFGGNLVEGVGGLTSRLISSVLLVVLITLLVKVHVVLAHLLLELLFQLFLLKLGHASGVDIGQQRGLLVGVGQSVLQIFLHNVLRLHRLVHRRNHALLHDLGQLVSVECYNDVLRFQVSVDNSALAMQVVKSNQDLLGHSPDERQRNALVVVSLHNFE